MGKIALSLKVGPNVPFGHDESIVLVEDGEILFGVEEERFSREKHGSSEFPAQALRAGMTDCQIELSDIDHIVLPCDTSLEKKRFLANMRKLSHLSSFRDRLSRIKNNVRHYFAYRLKLADFIKREFSKHFSGPIPPISNISHHKAHAISAHYLSPFQEGLVLTIDGMGEYDSTVIWKANQNGVRRIKTFKRYNSLGVFYSIVTKYLGYRPMNGEGKIMGLAPYGEERNDIKEKFDEYIDTSAQYDVSELTAGGDIDKGVEKLADIFGRPSKGTDEEFNQWHMNLAYAAQSILEEVTTNIVDFYCESTGESFLALAGGVTLNCKMNKCIRDLKVVDELFIQPVAHDAGLSLGGALSVFSPPEVPPMSTVYWGPKFSTDRVVDLLHEFKIGYHEPPNVERYIAERIAEGELVGWFQGRTEMGPRALGNRSILADPRSIESRDRVNREVKHREDWRPFAPSMLQEAAEDYLVDTTEAPYMIQTFDVLPDKINEIPAVIHPSDGTARPQTVTKEQNPRYYRLLKEFTDIAGVPVLLNTSFNDSGEPIVNTPREAIRDFYSMGLDILAVSDFVIEKEVK